MKTTTKLNLGAALFDLAEKGVRDITIYYSGSGDSGAIDDLVLEYNNSVKDKDIDLGDNWNKLQDILHDWAYKRLESEEDWYNNDGGEGHITIQVPSGEYEIHHGVREVRWSTSEGDLKEENYFLENE